MVTETLSVVEQRALRVLAVERRPIANAQLRDEHGVSLKAEQRQRLKQARLVEMRRVKGASGKPVDGMEITDAGLQWVATNEPPPLAAVGPGPRYGAPEYGIAERSVLLTLMAEGRALAPDDLKKLGVKVAPALRTRLQADRMVTVSARRVPGAKKPIQYIELSDDGWAWAARELAAETPEKAGVAGIALYAVLHGLQRFLERNQLVLADVFGDRALRPSAPQPTPAASPEGVDDRIRAAYASTAQFWGAWLDLADLRDKLTDLPRPAVDEALLRLHRAKAILLMPNDNLKTITERDRVAAIRIGERDRHYINVGG